MRAPISLATFYPSRMPARGDMEAADCRARAIRKGEPQRMSTDFYLHAKASDTVTYNAGHPIKTEWYDRTQ